MVLESELKDWLKSPVTQAFQEAVEAESETKKIVLHETIDGNDMPPDQLHSLVLISKATRNTYSQFLDNDLIFDMFNDHNLLAKEEEDNA